MFHNSVGGGETTTNRLSIVGEGVAQLDVAATSSPASADTGDWKAILWHLTYQAFPTPIENWQGGTLTIRGSGFASAFGSAEYGASLIRIAVDFGGVWTQGLSMSSEAKALGDIIINLPAAVSAVDYIGLVFQVQAFGGDAALQYDIDQIVIAPIPAPAAAPLLALAGLTARGRRRK
jgi:MYXO-CTERM domain-containing protein